MITSDTTDRPPAGRSATVDVLGRPVTPCCGALDLGPPERGGRPYQCLHEWEAWRDRDRSPRPEETP